MAKKKITAGAYRKLFAEYPDVVGIKEICKMLSIGRNKAYSLVNRGDLPKIPSYNSIKVLKISVIEYILKQFQTEK